MLCWISKGIVNLTRDSGCDGVINGIEYAGADANPSYFIQILGTEGNILSKKLMYLDQEQMLQDFAILKDCYINLMVGSNSGGRVRLFNPPQDLTNTIAQEERETSRRPVARDRDNGFILPPITNSFGTSINETINDVYSRMAATAFTTPSTGTYSLSYSNDTSGNVLVVSDDHVTNGDGT